MSTSILPWLPAIFVAVIAQTVKQKIGPTNMRAFLSSSPSAAATTLDTASHVTVPTKIPVNIHLDYPGSARQPNGLARLPAGKGLLPEFCPEIVKGLMRSIPRDLYKHDVGRTFQITNNLQRFETEEERWLKMKAELKELRGLVGTLQGSVGTVQDLRGTVEDFLISATEMDHAELDKVKPNIWHQLASRCGRDESEYVKRSEVQHRIPHERDMVDHYLSLVPCLRVVKKDPTYEVLFSAIFGLTSFEAKALYDFDKQKQYQVASLLSDYASLWKCAMANNFIGPYSQWLKAVRLLTSGQKVEPAFVEGLATEASAAARVDFGMADKKNLFRSWSHKRYHGIGLRNAADPYRWDKVVSDWKQRDLWPTLVKEWGFEEIKE